MTPFIRVKLVILNSYLELLLQNTAKRQQIANGTTTAIETDEGPKNISSSMSSEVAIVSDLYQVDEFKTLELLWAAENRLAQFPGDTRGLVAVLLYWDGRFALCSALRAICQSHVSVVNGQPGVEHIAEHFLQILFDGEIVKKLIAQYESLSVEGELDKLAKQKATGS